MSFFSRFYDFEKFPGIPREKFPNSQFFPFPWEKNLGGKTETLIACWLFILVFAHVCTE